MAGEALDHIYTSALSRTQQTAEPLAARAPMTQLADLNEHSLGVFEGRSVHEPGLVCDLRSRLGDPSDDLDGGESSDQHFERVARAVRLIQSAHPEGTVLVVAHGGTNRQLLRAWLKINREEASRHHQDHTELYLIELDGVEARLLVMPV